ncbi:MAG: helix-turn-helix domain-containing protein [Bacilli bacterium]|nr:helix-turn-helix domain-containing protein [Bacilli bacterium]
MTLGERLTELRKKKNLSQEEVAEKLNVTRQTVSKWELDQSTPDFDKIIPICKLYNITSEELLTGRKKDVNNDNIEYSLMTDEEIKKKTAIAISTSVGLFILSVIWIIIGSSIKFISDEVLVGIFLLIAGVGVVNIIYRLSVLPDKSGKQEKKERRKRIHKYDDAIAVLFVIIYLLVSFITGAWNITWILWIVYALVCEIVHIVLDKNEEE